MVCVYHNMRTSNRFGSYEGTHNGVNTLHEIVAGYEGTTNTAG